MIGPDSSILVALAQPCLGAFIGYLTNRIAIRMLFRPLRPWRILGWRVPLTPGIIPSKRHQLAASIGDMVGQRLLTSEEIGRALSREPFQEHISALVARHLEALLQREWPALQELFPMTGPVLQELQAGLGRELEGAICRFLAGGQAGEAMARWLQAADDHAGAGEGSGALRQLSRYVLAQMLDRGAEPMAALLHRLLLQAGADGRVLRDCVPEVLVLQLHGLLQEQTPAILERIGRQLLGAELRPALLAACIGAAHQLLDSLGPMGAMARGFFEEESFSKKIDAYLDAHSDTLTDWLASPALRQQAALVLQESADAFLNTPVAELLAGMGPARLDALCTAMGDRIVAALGSGAVAGQLESTLGEVLRHLLQGASDHGAKPGIALSALVGSAQGRACIGAAVASLVQHFWAQPLGRAGTWVPGAVQDLVATGLTGQINRLFLQELSGAMQALNLRELVRDKVDSLDLLQLERLLLDIMEEQFKYINLFGALLGFLIGLANLLLFRLV